MVLSVKSPQSDEGKRYYNNMIHAKVEVWETAVGARICLSMPGEVGLENTLGGGQGEERLATPMSVRERVQGPRTNMCKGLKIRENLVCSRICKYLRIV